MPYVGLPDLGVRKHLIYGAGLKCCASCIYLQRDLFGTFCGNKNNPYWYAQPICNPHLRGKGCAYYKETVTNDPGLRWDVEVIPKHLQKEERFKHGLDRKKPIVTEAFRKLHETRYGGVKK